ncbi:hypothetical protein IFR04_001812 [Cadophora malorum]|uniref:Heterokaryon incompatibility domain-containing protein n=1 Tax=Cadophora malorum TaxID=108018 RepID=A0A8H7WHU6_9HELO|nr:hypothetical protein IFR04_001812 [Cadophora malorum]
MSTSPEPSQLSPDESSYRPLADADEIRMLSFEAGNTKSDLRSSVVYVGSGFQDDLTRRASFSVRENLWQALFHLRVKDSNRVLWIDAICINQADEGERNHQVMQTGQSFSRASRVLAWLGLDYPTTYVALDALKRVAKAPKYFVPRPRQSFGLHFLRSTNGMNRAERMQIELQSEETEAIEELLLPGLLATAVDCERFKEPLGSLCRKYGSFMCEDVKDNMFGLHAMAPPCFQEATVVDYGAPWSSIWQSVMAHHFSRHQNWPRLVVSMTQELQQKLAVGQKVSAFTHVVGCSMCRFRDPCLAVG